MDQRTTLSLEFVERQRNRLEALRDQLRGEEEQAVAAQQSFQQAYGSEAHEFEDEGLRRGVERIRSRQAFPTWTPLICQAPSFVLARRKRLHPYIRPHGSALGRGP